MKGFFKKVKDRIKHFTRDQIEFRDEKITIDFLDIFHKNRNYYLNMKDC